MSKLLVGKSPLPEYIPIPLSKHDFALFINSGPMLFTDYYTTYKERKYVKYKLLANWKMRTFRLKSHNIIKYVIIDGENQIRAEFTENIITESICCIYYFSKYRPFVRFLRK